MLWSNLFLLSVLLFINKSKTTENKLKRDIRDYTEADLERLYEEWGENDNDDSGDNEKPGFVHQIPKVNLEEMKKMVRFK